MADAAGFQATERPRGRWLRRTVTLFTGVPLLVASLQLPQAATARADSAGSHPVSVTINAMSPAAPGKDDTVTVSGTLTNDSKNPITGAHVGLHRGAALNDRSSIEAVTKRTGYQPGADGEEIAKHTEKVDRLDREPAGPSP